jgi:hypothetical protein
VCSTLPSSASVTLTEVRKRWGSRDEAILLARRKRPETDGEILMIGRQREAIMLISILNLIYREFLKSAVPGMASLGGRRQ